jgi:NAD(P)-dependent dehydrogenase (short-subunit alcohol dehydrogenase family)
LCTAPVRRGRFAAAGALIETAGGVAASATADVSDDGAVAQAITKLRHELGPVDLLVNNAGIVGPVGPTWEIEPDRWWRTMEVNLRGTSLCTQLVLPEMVHRRRGPARWPHRDISSQAGVFRWPLVSAYSVSKAAVAKLTENLARETHHHGVSVFSVHPTDSCRPDSSSYRPDARPTMSSTASAGSASRPSGTAGIVDRHVPGPRRSSRPDPGGRLPPAKATTSIKRMLQCRPEARAGVAIDATGAVTKR